MINLSNPTLADLYTLRNALAKEQLRWVLKATLAPLIGAELHSSNLVDHNLQIIDAAIARMEADNK